MEKTSAVKSETHFIRETIRNERVQSFKGSIFLKVA